MRDLFVTAAWPEAPTPPGAWIGVDANTRPVVVGHVGDDTSPPPAIAVNEDKSVRAVLAGGLHNRRELRASLGGRHAFSGRDDAELAIHLYEDRGVQAVNSLRGAFALALWDGRRRRLLLARDQLGLMPLYYAFERGKLAASSALAPLAGLPGLVGSWDATALDAFLVLGAVSPPATLHAAIRQLHPGELLVWEDDRLRPQRYWQVVFPERRLAGSTLPGILRDQMRDALRLRHGGVMAGLLLSGGLDAAALLALAVADHRPPTHAFTAAPPGTSGDDLRVAQRLIARTGIEHVVVTDAPDWAATADALIAAHAGAVSGLEATALGPVARRAGAGVRALLAGVGGEEVFGGSPPVQAAERVRRYQQLPGLMREATHLWARVAPPRWTHALRGVVHHERLAPLELYGRTVSVFLPEERAELYTPEALATLGETHPWSPLTALFAEAVGVGATETADVLHFVELTLRLPARVAAARAALGGMPLLAPLADHRVAQLIASAAAPERGSPRGRQLVLRAALGDLLPQAVQRRPHVGCVPTAAAWETGTLRDLLEETLAPTRLAAQGVFNPDTVARLRREQAAGRADHGARLWAIVLATRWIVRQARPATTTLRAVG